MEALNIQNGDLSNEADLKFITNVRLQLKLELKKDEEKYEIQAAKVYKELIICIV